MAHNLARWTARIGLGEQTVTTKTLRRRVFALAERPTRSARRSPCIFPIAGRGRRGSVASRPDCGPFHSQPYGGAPPPLNRQLNVPANSRHPGPRTPFAVSYPAISLTTATVGCHRRPKKHLQTARQPPVYPNSSPDHRTSNSLTPLPLSSRRPSVSIGGFGLSPRLWVRSCSTRLAGQVCT